MYCLCIGRSHFDGFERLVLDRCCHSVTPPYLLTKLQDFNHCRALLCCWMLPDTWAHNHTDQQLDLQKLKLSFAAFLKLAKQPLPASVETHFEPQFLLAKPDSKLFYCTYHGKQYSHSKDNTSLYRSFQVDNTAVTIPVFLKKYLSI